MSMFTNFISVIVSATTLFSGSIINIDVDTPLERPYTNIQSYIDDSSSMAQGSNMAVGIAIVDRANKNSMRTNGDTAHRPMKMETMGRLPILLHAVRVDSSIAKNKVPDITAMAQGLSGEATDRMWEKYGGSSIIRDISQRYNLQETTPGSSWDDTTSSAVDIARMYRRFLDDPDVTTGEKKWVISLLRGTSLSIAGEDFSWGLPSAMGVIDNETLSDNDSLAWMQGWSASGEDPMIRSTSGVIGKDMRFIVVITGRVPTDTSNPDANRVSSEVSTSLVGDEKLYTDDDKIDSQVEKFTKHQEKKFKSFIGE